MSAAPHEISSEIASPTSRAGLDVPPSTQAGAHKASAAFEATWSDEQVTKLTALWGEELSTAAIGRRMGLSKNSVVGKAHRLHLPSRPNPVSNAAMRSSKPKPQRAAKPISVTSHNDRHLAPMPPKVVYVPPSTPPSRVCLYPLWSLHQKPTHKYCNAPSFGSWCDTHRAKVFVPSKPHIAASEPL